MCLRAVWGLSDGGGALGRCAGGAWWWCVRAVRGRGAAVWVGVWAFRACPGRWKGVVGGATGGGDGLAWAIAFFHRHLSAEFPLLGIPCASVDAVDVRVSVASRVSERERVPVCPMGLKAAPPRPSA